jgi:hypothetical protein
VKDWRKRFRSFWTAINKDYELNFETGDDRRVSGEVEDFIFSVLTTQKESFIKIIRETRKNIWAGLHERQEWAIKDEVIEHIDKMIAELERKI